MIESTHRRSLVPCGATCALQAIVAMVAAAVSGCGPRVLPAEVSADPPPQVAPQSPAPSAGADAGSQRPPVASPPQPLRVIEAVDERADPGGGIAVQPTPSDARAAALQALAAALTQAQVGILGVAPLEAGCAELPAQATRVSLSLPAAGLDCALGQDLHVCVPAIRDPDKQRKALCAAARSASPAQAAGWPAALEPALAPLWRTGWQVRPLAADGATPALVVHAPTGAASLLVRDGVTWQVLRDELPPAEPQDEHAGLRAVLAAAGLGHDARYLVVTDEYEGGSERGWQTRWLLVLCGGGGTALTVCASKAIGALVWSLGPGERARHPRGGASLTGRPHLEVSLTPRLGPGDEILRLELTRRTLPAKLRARFRLPPPECEPSGDPLAPGGCDPWSALDALRADAGRWRFDGQALLRDGGTR